ALCTTGKVSLDGERALDPAARVRAGQRVELRPNAPRPQTLPAGFRIALEDAHLVMIEKPSGISSVPYDRKETGTALDLIRAAWRRAGKRHTATRAYLAVAEGDVAAQRIESRLVADRGDGIRGSTRYPDQGQLAITYVEPLRHYARQKSAPRGEPTRPIVATLCRVRLETGRTHQIRIHLSERGHPLLGETVYVRELFRAGQKPYPAPRLMLHAGLLGFPHPVTGEPIQLPAELPDGGHDPTFLERTAPLLEFLWSRYFRVRLLGVENVPATGAAMLVGNHSGGIPYDGALLLHGIHRDHPSHRRVRPLVANFAFRSGWMANIVARI